MATATAPALRRARAYRARAVDAVELGDWPNTTRLLPWGIAAFLAMIFLVPFNAVSLPIALPLDGSLDRYLLIALVGLWLMASFVLPRSQRPRIEITGIHLAALAFFLVALTTAVVNAPVSIQAKEFDVVVKKLALLASYLLFFGVVASSLRPAEVPRMIRLMLVLACIAGIGSVIEFRQGYNVFYELIHTIVPGWITMPDDLYQRDSIGRLSVYGPSGHPLELATMLGLVLPFTLVGFMDSEGRRKFLYVVGAAILLSGALATSRKTSVVASGAGLIVLIAYRPRLTVRKMVPLALMLGVVIHFAAPGALGTAFGQLLPSQFFGVLSTRDRTADYDAVKPDITKHLLLGRGFQNYDPDKYRILDNQFLLLVLGVGLLGLLAYLAMLSATLARAHRGIMHNLDPKVSSAMLAASAAVATLVVATGLFDVLSFPHVPYLFFFLAALIVVCSPAKDELKEPLA